MRQLHITGLHMLRRLTAARAEKNHSRACALCAVFLRHIFAVARTLRVPLSQPQKYHIQPERYTKYPINWLKSIDKIKEM
jgi:hypothetical protein